MKIFFVAPEVAPFTSVGGLGEVVGSLPKYLKNLGHDVRVVCPAYGCIKNREGWVPLPAPLEVWIGHEKRLARVWETKIPGSDVTAYFIEYNFYFGRPEVYDSPWGAFQDNDHRFVFFTRAAIDLCNYLDWMPDAFHCHDWTSALLPVYLNTHDKGQRVAQAATVLSLHNVQFQGTFYSGLVEWAHLPRAEVFHSDNLESMGGINMLKGGIYNATKVVAVSPTYAKEIQTREGGFGLGDVLRYRLSDLSGIANGIDTQVWDPTGDKDIPACYNADDFSGKAFCKRELQRTFGLIADPAAPIFGMESRLVHQKGLDLVLSLLPRLMTQTRIQIVIQGTGEQALQRALSAMAEKYPGRMGVRIGYNLAGAKLIYAGSDALMMPSRFEPCGLSQMHAMRYGTLPVARATGGLLDTIIPCDPKTGEGTGFLFKEPTADALEDAIQNACRIYYDEPKTWQRLQRQAMAQDFNWTPSAKKYEAVYAAAVEKRTSQKR